MHITILTIDSRGDVQPSLVLATVYTEVLKSHLKLGFVALALKLGGEIKFRVAQNWGIYGAKRVETLVVYTCVYTIAFLRGVRGELKVPKITANHF